MSKFRGALAAMLLLGFSAPACAYDWSLSAHVTQVEGTYMPTQIPFSIDAAAGSCATGATFYWNIKGADTTTKNINAQSIFALLLTAKSSGQKIVLFGNNSGCTVDFIYLQ